MLECRAGDLLRGEGFVGAGNAELACLKLDIGLGGLQQVGGYFLSFVDKFIGCDRGRGAAENGGAGRKGAAAPRCGIGVAVGNPNVIRVDAEPVGDDDLVHRVVALTMRNGTGNDGERAGGFELDADGFPGKLCGLFDEICDTDPA